MKRIITTLALIVATVLSVSAQKSITNVPCNADKVVKWWDNKKAPHSNEETKDEERNEKAVLFEQTTRLAVAYKQSIVDELLKETMNKLKDPTIANDSNRYLEVMQNFKFLKETQQILNNVLKGYGFGNAALNV